MTAAASGRGLSRTSSRLKVLTKASAIPLDSGLLDRREVRDEADRVREGEPRRQVAIAGSSSYQWLVAAILLGAGRPRASSRRPAWSFSDILDNFDYVLNGRRARAEFGAYVNAIYADLSDADKVAGIRIKADAQTVWAGAGAYCRLHPALRVRASCLC